MKKVFSIIIGIAMLFTAAFGLPAYAGDIKTIDYEVMNKEEAKDFKQHSEGKISSNAHSYAFEAKGIVFEWDGKQKEDGLLTVEEIFFTEYKSLTLMVKMANEYRAVTITEAGKYSIPKLAIDGKGKAKNINMVYIGNLIPADIPADSKFRTIVVSSPGSGITAKSFLGALDEIFADVVQTDTGSLYGADAWDKAFTNKPEGDADRQAYNDMKSIVNDLLDISKGYTEAKWISNTNPATNPQVGEVVRYAKAFNIPGEQITNDMVTLRIASDNGFVVFVNNNYVGKSNSLLMPYTKSFEDIEDLKALFGDRTQINGFITHGGWDKVYSYDIKPFLTSGDNYIVIYGVNCAWDSESGLDEYNAENNPSGLMFSFAVNSEDITD